MFNCVLFVYVLFLSLVRKKKIPKRKYTVCARRSRPGSHAELDIDKC